MDRVRLPDPPPALLREVVRRAGGRCCLCGRPCREGDAWRHSEPGPAGERPENFSAMCPACMAVMVGKGLAPARYVVHVRDPALSWHRARVAAAEGLMVLILGVYLAYAGFIAWVVARMPRAAGWLPATTAAVLMMLAFGALLVRGLLDRRRAGRARRAVGRDARLREEVR